MTEKQKKKKEKTLFRVAIQKYEGGKPKRFGNVVVKESDSFDRITDKIHGEMMRLLFDNHFEEENKEDK